MKCVLWMDGWLYIAILILTYLTIYNFTGVGGYVDMDKYNSIHGFMVWCSYLNEKKKSWYLKTWQGDQ